MDPFRLSLFLGLVAHKLVWVALAWRTPQPRARRSLAVRGIKLIKAGVLGFLLVQTLCLDVLPISDEPVVLQAAGAALFATGLTIAVLGRLQLGDNWVDLEDYQVLRDQALVTRGIYRLIRHPIYGGDLLLLLGLELALNSWLVLAVLAPVAVVVRQALAEESILAGAFPGYGAYSARTKRFIPFIV